MNKKKIISFVIALILLVSIGFTQNAYAASNWQLTNEGWKYSKDSTMKTGWVLENSNWYYVNNSGIMETGWIDDNGTWYFLCETGAMDNSKTTTIMPAQIEAIYNIIKAYDNPEILKYSCIYHVGNNGYFAELGFSGENLYKFYSQDKYGNEIREYYYDPSYGNVYELNQGVITLLCANEVVDHINKSITSDEAIKNVKEYLTNNNKYVPNKIEYDHEYGSSYIIHCYDIIVNHTSTYGWYYVDKFTGNITPII